MRFCLLLVAIFAITFIYVSCNKHIIQKSTVSVNKVLNGWSHSTNPQLRTELSFNEAQKVTKEETDSDISSYHFMNDSLIIREFNKDENRYVYEFKGKLDNQTRLISGTATSSYIPNTPDTVHHAFEYDKKGHLISEKRISSLSDTFRIDYEYEDDIVRKVSTYTNEILYNTKEFTYYDNDLSYDLPEETKFRRNINNLVGRSEQKLIKKVVSTGRSGKQKYILNYEYKMDESGYVSRMISKKGKKASGVMTFNFEPASNVSKMSIAAK